ncbi:autotransporter-associated beta strand repeat-containing protein, partial [Salmonella enterica]|uniref:autotransporter-associated beta strand repeat-containing protein n=1 Tax=Salmonella enterica TaxID=28901 RepID=UPI0021B31B21
TLNGPLSGAGSITKDGTGTMLLAGNATNSGPTTVKAGTLVAGGTNVFSAASAYTVAANAAVDLKGYDQSVQSLSNDGLVT